MVHRCSALALGMRHLRVSIASNSSLGLRRLVSSQTKKSAPGHEAIGDAPAVS